MKTRIQSFHIYVPNSSLMLTANKHSLNIYQMNTASTYFPEIPYSHLSISKSQTTVYNGTPGDLGGNHLSQGTFCLELKFLSSLTMLKWFSQNLAAEVLVLWVVVRIPWKVCKRLNQLSGETGKGRTALAWIWRAPTGPLVKGWSPDWEVVKTYKGRAQGEV